MRRLTQQFSHASIRREEKQTYRRDLGWTLVTVSSLAFAADSQTILVLRPARALVSAFAAFRLLTRLMRRAYPVAVAIQVPKNLEQAILKAP